VDLDGPASGDGRTLPPGCALPFLILVWLVGLALTVDYVRLAVRAVRVAGWPEVPARVEAAELDDFSDGDGQSQRLHVRFRYEVGGRSFRSDTATVRQRTVLFNDDLFLTSSARNLATARTALRSAAPLPCRVNPADPSEAYLFAVSPREWVEPTLLCAIFGLLPLGTLWFWVRARISARGSATPSSSL
jgi:hypothetical protein